MSAKAMNKYDKLNLYHINVFKRNFLLFKRMKHYRMI